MITSLLIEGVAKILWFRKDEHSPRKVCRIYSLSGRVPEKVLIETEENVFVDSVNHIKISLKNGLPALVN